MVPSSLILALAWISLAFATPIDLRRRDPTSVVVKITLGTCGKCDISSLQLPSDSSLPPPSAGLRLLHIALGRGTQNYTCDLSNSTAIPAAVGAVASLYNSTCLEKDSAALSDALPNISLDLPQPASNTQTTISGAYLGYSGTHYFYDTTTPVFDLRTPTHDYGVGAFKKSNAAAAPAGAKIGPLNSGDGAVPWLKLKAAVVPGITNTIQEVYRVHTAGGSPPKTCQGQRAAFEVQYAAQYWFYG